MFQVVTGKRPRIPGCIPAFISELISKCWSGDPTVRPTFSEMLNILHENEFKISPECDSRRETSANKNMDHFLVGLSFSVFAVFEYICLLVHSERLVNNMGLKTFVEKEENCTI
jgi:hypothetical protein